MENLSDPTSFEGSGLDVELLVILNEEQAMRYLPVIIYMSLLMVLGTTGNSLVCYVFYNKLYRSTSRLFILTLSVLDLTCCVVGMAVEIVDLRYPYTFDNIVACRILRFTTFATSIASGTVLVCVAFDRYFKVCRPIKKQLSGRFIRRMCVGAVFVGAFCSWPAVLLFGIRKVETGHTNIVGKDCSTTNSMTATVYPIVYYTSLLSLFLGGLITLVILYILIGTRLYHLRKKRNKPHGTMAPALSAVSVNSGAVSVRIVPGRKPTLTRRLSRALRHTTKTTWMLFVITLAFILSFLPYLIVMILRHAVPGFESTQYPAHQLLVNFCLRSYFINSSINPLIYALMNQQFRSEISNLFTSCKLRCVGNKYL